LERQAGNEEGGDEDRQKTLAGTAKSDGLALGDHEVLSSTGLSATSDLHGVTSRLNWYLDRVVHVKGSDALTVNHDLVGATSDFDSD
jgi:hypothetical protein